jgi:hypothetical protein
MKKIDLDAAWASQVADLYQQGISMNAIYKELGGNKWRVSKALAIAGVEKRDRIPPIIRRTMHLEPVPRIISRLQFVDCWFDDGLVRTRCLDYPVTNDEGYGKVQLDGRQQPVHRIMYEHWVGPVPDDHDIDHLATTRTNCVRAAPPVLIVRAAICGILMQYQTRSTFSVAVGSAVRTAVRRTARPTMSTRPRTRI